MYIVLYMRCVITYMQHVWAHCGGQHEHDHRMFAHPSSPAPTQMGMMCKGLWWTTQQLASSQPATTHPLCSSPKVRGLMLILHAHTKPRDTHTIFYELDPHYQLWKCCDKVHNNNLQSYISYKRSSLAKHCTSNLLADLITHAHTYVCALYTHCIHTNTYMYA